MEGLQVYVLLEYLLTASFLFDGRARIAIGRLIISMARSKATLLIFIRLVPTNKGPYI